MKKIFFLVIALLIMASCGSDDIKEPELSYIDEHGHTDGYSSDSTYMLRVHYDRVVLYRNNEPLWTVNYNHPQPIKVSTGYGEYAEYAFSTRRVYFANLNPIVYLIAHNNAIFDFYDINGNQLKRLETICYESSFSSNDLLVISENKFSIYNNTGKLIKETPCNAFDKIYLYDSTLLISDSIYVTYNNANIYIADLNKGKIVGFNVEDLVKNNFPDESNTPKASIKEINAVNDIVYITINYTLYNGEKGLLKFAIKSINGEIENI